VGTGKKGKKKKAHQISPARDAREVISSHPRVQRENRRKKEEPDNIRHYALCQRKKGIW